MFLLIEIYVLGFILFVMMGLLFVGCPKDSSLPEIPEFEELKAGSFQMGCSAGDVYQKPVHTVTFSRAVEICVHEVTQSEYEAYCVYGDAVPSGSYGDGNELPAYNVSWYDALVYCNKRSIVEGLTPCYSIYNSTVPSDWGVVPSSAASATKAAWDAVICNFNANGYRLPTEAEWEYAARGGNDITDSVIYCGTNSVSDLGYYAWYSSNAGNRVQKVKSRACNANKLYDMSGNVAEWCWDSWFGYTAATAINPSGGSGSSHIIRGGSAYDDASACSVTYRDNVEAFTRDQAIGFRVVRRKGGTTGSSYGGTGGGGGSSGGASGAGGSGQTSYTVFHYQQKVTGGNSYDLAEMEFDKSVTGTPALAALAKTYTGFEPDRITSGNGNVYVFYNRKTITYTFETGTDGAFTDGETSKTVTGLYGASFEIPGMLPDLSAGYSTKSWFNWTDADGTIVVPKVFGSENVTFTAEWYSNSSEMVLIAASESVPRNYYICNHEVTEEEYVKYILFNPYALNEPYFPVCNVCYFEAIVYCNKRSMAEGFTPCYTIANSSNPDDWGFVPKNNQSTNYFTWNAVECDLTVDGYRLPTKDEWQYAAKGGQNYTYAGSNNLGDVGWYYSGAGDWSLHNVKGKNRNGYCLFDMSGNVNELIQGITGSECIYMGGSAGNTAESCKITYQNEEYPWTKNVGVGFRVVRTCTN